jgi:hypothetical protein
MKKILKTLLTGFENTIVILAIPFVFCLATFLQLADELEEKEM